MYSHPERKEKICLNCKASLIGRYCHVCGQENREPRESIGELIAHFFRDITHYDGKFFRSVRLLFLHPGKLPMQYVEGRRADYLNPVRMYVFTSALFFLIFYALFTPKEEILSDNLPSAKPAIEWGQWKQKAYGEAETRADSNAIDSVFDRLQLRGAIQKSGADSTRSGNSNSGQAPLVISKDDELFRYDSAAQYDSVQATLPTEKRDGWFIRQLVYRQIGLVKKYDGDAKRILLAVADRFIHMFPYLLFLSLPVFGLFLKLIYLRHARFYFVEHLVFLLYLYIFTFLFLLLYFGLDSLKSQTGWGILGWVLFFYFLYGVYYAYSAMRNFYMQGRGKTIVKFILLNTLSSITLLILFILFLAISVFQI